MPRLSPDELEHYGRIGMKWYQHKYGEVDGRSKYMHKGFKKLASDERKSQRNQNRAEKNAYRASKLNSKRARYSDYDGDHSMLWNYDVAASKAAKKSSKYQLRANRQIRRGEKTARKMVEMFGTLKTSELSPDEIRLGKKYAMDIFEDRTRKQMRKQS